MIRTTLLAWLLFATHFIYSQETIPASGGDAIGPGGSSSYSVGQLFYSSVTETNGSISQGVQQSIEHFVLSNPELTTVNLKAISYPNPTTDYIVLALTDADLTNLSYILYDLHGKPVSKGMVTQANTKIDMRSLASSVYILKVSQNNQELKTFKINKK
jgi:hypothetical protein